jgi:putative SOS response-associated peptidase YedK
MQRVLLHEAKEQAMCYYSSISVGFKIIEDRFGVRFVQTESFLPVYSVSAFTFPSLPVICNEDASQVVFMRWGLIPFWIKDLAAATTICEKTLNARGETIFEKPAFRNSIRYKRCLVPADGFFEWRHENGKAYPYYIRLKNHALFALAGIWDSWANRETGETIRSFAVVTTRANPLLEKIHNTKKRMPVILPADREKVWLQSPPDQETLQSLLTPYDMCEMEAFPVSGMVNKLGLNVTHPEVTARHLYPGLPDLI